MNNGILVNNAYYNAGFEDNGIKGSFNPPAGAICSQVPLPYHLPNYPYSYNIDYRNLVMVFDVSVSSGRTISLQFQSGGATVDWGDGNRVVYNVSVGTVVSYTYKDYGTYVVQFITPGYAQIYSLSASLGKLVKILSFGNLNTSNFYLAFINAPFLNEVPRNLPSSATNIGSMFVNATRLNDPNISYWDTSNVTSISSLFGGCSNFNQPLDNWNVRKVTDFGGNGGMFANCSNFNSTLNNWELGLDTSGTSCAGMFSGATSFNQPLDSWNVRKVTNFGGMFNLAASFNSSLSGWALGADVSNVSCSQMFRFASVFNQDIGNWDVSKVTIMQEMLAHANTFNNGGSSSISTWNTSNVTSMIFMFWNAYVFNQPIGSWNVSKVTNMSAMFQSARSFNQDISSWNLAGINVNTGLDGFMNEKTGANSYSTANYNALLIGWNNNKLASANGVANWRSDLRPNFGGAKYTGGGAAAAARAALVSYGWTITDGGVA